MKLKLGMYPRTQLENNRCEDGLTVIEAVHKEQLRVREKNCHIVIGFWKSLIARHRLVGGVTDALEAPTQEEKVLQTLDAALKAAHCSNPAQKTSAPLVRLLSYLGVINAT